MAWGDILSALRFWSTTPYVQWDVTSANPAAIPVEYEAADVPSNDTVAIVDYLEDLYNGSDIAEDLLDNIVAAGTLRVASNTEQNISAAVLSASDIDDYILFNSSVVNNLHFFNSSGKLIAMDPRMVLAHELVHLEDALDGTIDDDDPSNADANNDAAQNASDFDFLGGTVPIQNDIAAEIGLTDYTEVNYYAVMNSVRDASLFANFTTNFSYTNGETIDIARFARTSGANNIDHSARTDDSRDLLFGLDGNDTIKGGDGNDFLYGGDGNDQLNGGSDADWIEGGADNDTIFGSSGEDTIDGGGGLDTVDYSTFDNKVTVNLSVNSATTHGYLVTHNQVLYDVENVIGGDYDDTITGDDENNALNGFGGDDIINGAGGNDILIGGKGNDTLIGGSGVDTYYFLSGDGNDVVTDSDAQSVIIINGVKLTGTATLVGDNAYSLKGYTLYFDDNGANNNKQTGDGVGDIYIPLPGGGGISLSDVTPGGVDGQGGGIGYGITFDKPADPIPPAVPGGGGGASAYPNTSGDQVNAMFDQFPSSPLVLDLDKDGLIELTAYANTNTIFFDLDADGFAEQTGWVSADDGLLAIDLNSDGIINDITELFGNSTTDGFIELAALDSNSDGVINASDASFADLLVWNDANENGYSDVGELTSLSANNITSIDLNYTALSGVENEGHPISSESTVTLSDSSTMLIQDVWFEHNQANSVQIIPSSFTYDASVTVLPNLRGSGDVASLWVAMTNDASLKQQVVDLVDADYSTFDFASFSDDVQDIMFKWLGVDGVDPASRGQYVDARILEAAEAWAGRDFVKHGGNNPPEHGAAIIHDIWSQMVADTALKFIAQIPGVAAARGYATAAEVLQDEAENGVDVNSLTQAEIDALIESDLSNAIAAAGNHEFVSAFPGFDYDYSKNLVELDFANLVNTIASNEPTLTADKNVYWLDLLPLINAAAESTNVSDADYTTALTNTYLDSITSADLVSLRVERFTIGSEGNDTLSGSERDNFFFGDKGDDIFTDDGGNDIYTYYVGDGNDTITDTRDHPSFSISDTIVLGEGFATTDVVLTRTYQDPNDLVISFNNAQGSITIVDQFADTGVGLIFNEVENLEFDDGTIWTSQDIENLLLNPTSGDDVLLGYRYNDTIDGGDGNDTITGGIFGDDLLYGGAGNDLIDQRGESASSSFADDTIYGGDGNDTIYASHHNDLVYGDAGDDVIYAGDHNNTVYGGDGNDTISANNGVDSLSGDAGDDFIEANGSNDQIDGGSGNDYLFGGFGQDTITAGLGNDELWGGNYNPFITTDITGYADFEADRFVITAEASSTDTIHFFSSSSGDKIDLTDIGITYNAIIIDDDGTDTTITLNDGQSIILKGVLKTAVSESDFIGLLPPNPYQGSALSDTISGDASANLIEGLGGDDTLSGGLGNDTIYGGDGNDTLSGGAGINVLYGGIGDDEIYIDGAASTIYGGDGNDLVNGAFDTTGSHVIYGGEGNDTLSGFEGDDYLEGGAGDDSLSGLQGDNTLDGGAGNDYIVADWDNNTVLGGEGNDTIHLFLGNNEVDAGAGDDSVHAFSAPGVNGVHSVSGGDGNDWVRTDSGNDTLDGGIGNDTLNGRHGDDIIYGGDGDDSLIGWSDQDSLFGDSGNDTLNGGFGDDSLEGGAGDDIVIASRGQDTLTGGDGIDTFVIENQPNTGTTTTITDFDFVNGRERIDLGAFSLSLSAVFAATTVNAQGHAQIDLGDSQTLIVENVKDPDALNHFMFTGLTDTPTPYTESDNIILTYASDDVVDGEDGNDIIASQDGDDLVFGAEGDDQLLGGDDEDTLIGGVGADTLNGGAGNDVLFGGDGNDDIDDRTGNDLIYAGAGDDEVTTGPDTDGAADTVYGGEGNDTILTGSGADSVFGEGGDDYISVAHGYDLVHGGDGNDTIYGDLGTATTSGGDDTMYGGLGNDLLYGFGEADEIYGGNDDANDTLDGNDTIYGRDGNDTLHGEAGADFVYGDDGADTVDGGAGNDSLFGDLSSTDSVGGGDGDVVRGGTGIDKIYGYGGNDTLYGGNNDSGDTDTDSIYGGFGDDVIHGEGGNDWLQGDAGNDSFTGGADIDTFFFYGTNSGNDVITDFEGAGVGGGDAIRIASSTGITAFNQLQIDTSVADEATITLSTGNTITLTNFTDTLYQHDFFFG